MHRWRPWSAGRDREPYVFAALQLDARGCLLAEWSEDERAAAYTLRHDIRPPDTA